jgi:hypothetical protein
MNPASKSSTKQSANNDRQYYLDWIRTATILIVFLFHGCRFFDSVDWHIKNAALSPVADFITFFLKGWMMPLFFFISGAGAWFALAYKSAGKFAKDRVKRILVPLLFGIFILSPPQVYLERLSHRQFSGSFWQFMPHYFSGWYSFGGNFAWMGLHLWYLLLLFIFSFISLPVLLWWKKRKTHIKASFPLLILFVFVILLAMPGAGIPLDNILLNRGFGGWGIIEHLIIFLTGYYAFSTLNMQQLMTRFRYFFLVLAIVTTAIQCYLYLNQMLFEFGTAGYCLKVLLRSLVCYSWILCILGLAANAFNYSNNILKYCNEAVLPFYIAHQPVMLLAGYFIVQYSLAPGVKYLLIVTVSFCLVMLCYESIIKKVNGLRYLFGMNKASVKQMK